MTSLVNEVQITGIGLMDGKESKVRLVPTSKNGIYFYPDNSDIAVKAVINNVISTLHCTVLGKGNKQVRVTEHFMAACAFAGIDSLEVYMSTSEIPILDGSAKEWVEAFQKAGIEQTNTNSSFSVNQPVYFSEGNSTLVMLPSEEFRITYGVNFAHPELERKWYSWNVSSGMQEIIEARTFGYLKDLEKFQQAGFALGAKIDNTVGLTETGYTIELRSKDEPVKHKILDLIGDLNLLNINPLSLKAHIIAQEAGHRTHLELAKVLQDYMESNVCQQMK